MILYDSTNIKVLELPDSVRKRPGMYFGDVKNTGANTVVNELLANSIDQFLAGKLTHIKILIKESVIQFSDDGPGLPFSQTSPDNANNTLVEHYLTKRHDSATADLHAPHVHVVTGGLGLAVLNAVSETIIIDSSDGKTLWHQEFGKGQILSSLSKEKSKKPSGTTFKLKLDNKIFGKNAFDMPQLRKTVFELAHFYSGLTLEFQDERFHSKEGLLDLANFFYKKPSNSLSLTKQFSFTGKSENVQVHLAAIGDSSNETEYFSWVNGIESVGGGTHVNGIESSFSKTDWQPKMVFLHVIMHDPKFAGPTRDELCNAKIADVLENLLLKPICQYLVEYQKEIEQN